MAIFTDLTFTMLAMVRAVIMSNAVLFNHHGHLPSPAIQVPRLLVITVDRTWTFLTVIKCIVTLVMPCPTFNISTTTGILSSNSTIDVVGSIYRILQLHALAYVSNNYYKTSLLACFECYIISFSWMTVYVLVTVSFIRNLAQGLVLFLKFLIFGLLIKNFNAKNSLIVP